MKPNDVLLQYVCRLGDNALVLSQRMVELVATLPDLEEELANANFALDYIGQARMFYSYAAELEGAGRSEDDFAFQRDEQEFQNVLLVEQPNRHFGDAVAKLVLFDTFYLALLDALKRCTDERIVSIAARAEKEIRYHLRHTTQWFVRLGDGTELSHKRMQQALEDLWPFSGELFDADTVDDEFRRQYAGPDLAAVQDDWVESMHTLVREATLDLPQGDWMQSGGKKGHHTESFGYLLAEMQSLPRAHPEATW